MTQYNIIEINNFGTVSKIIQKIDGELFSYIPMDESNSDYQRYLRWLENPDAELGGTL